MKFKTDCENSEIWFHQTAEYKDVSATKSFTAIEFTGLKSFNLPWRVEGPIKILY
jgi:hypothetical protein